MPHEVPRIYHDSGEWWVEERGYGFNHPLVYGPFPTWGDALGWVTARPRIEAGKGNLATNPTPVRTRVRGSTWPLIHR